jgi:hypothetical protein
MLGDERRRVCRLRCHLFDRFRPHGLLQRFGHGEEVMCLAACRVEHEVTIDVLPSAVVLADREVNLGAARVRRETLEVLHEVRRRCRVIRLRDEEERSLLGSDDHFSWNG